MGYDSLSSNTAGKQTRRDHGTSILEFTGYPAFLISGNPNDMLSQICSSVFVDRGQKLLPTGKLFDIGKI